MPFERHSLRGPKGLVIQGPEEHIGESRYHWLEEVTSFGKSQKKSGMEMLLRIEKKKCSTKDYDCHSPIISLHFEPEGLLICLDTSQKLQFGNLRACANPYTNALACNTPGFLIQTRHWKEQLYTVNYRTNAWGDFLLLESQPHIQDSEKEMHQLLLLNLWAIFSMVGLHRVHSDGTLYFGNEMIGQVPTRNGEILPFFVDVLVSYNFGVVAHTLRDFQKRSAERAFEIVRNKKADSDFCPADVFDLIAESVFGDRSQVSLKKGLCRAKKEFPKLFPEAVSS